MAVTFPIAQDLVIVQGSRLVARIDYSTADGPVDWTDHTIKSEVWGLGSLVLDLSPYWTPRVGGADLFVPATVTDDITRGGTWDLLVIPPGDDEHALRMYAGKAKFRKGVTDLDGTAPGAT
jgi:hypothetical protein